MMRTFPFDTEAPPQPLPTNVNDYISKNSVMHKFHSMPPCTSGLCLDEMNPVNACIKKRVKPRV